MKKKVEYWTESNYCKKFCKEYIAYHPNGNIESHGWKCESSKRGIWNYWREDGSINSQQHHGTMNFGSNYGEVTHTINWHKNGYKTAEINERAIKPWQVDDCKQWDEDGEAWLVHRDVMNNDGVILGDIYSDGSKRPKAERYRIKRIPSIVKVVDIQEDEMPF